MGSFVVVVVVVVAFLLCLSFQDYHDFPFLNVMYFQHCSETCHYFRGVTTRSENIVFIWAPFAFINVTEL